MAFRNRVGQTVAGNSRKGNLVYVVGQVGVQIHAPVRLCLDTMNRKAQCVPVSDQAERSERRKRGSMGPGRCKERCATEGTLWSCTAVGT